MYCILFTVLCTISLLQVSLFCTVTFAKESFFPLSLLSPFPLLASYFTLSTVSSLPVLTVSK